MIEKQDQLIAEKNAAIMEKHSALEAVTMKLADMETLVDEVAGQAYEKACEVVTDTVRQETQKEDIKILDDYSKWLSAPERTDDKKLRNYAVRHLETLKEKFLKSAKGIMEKVAKSLQKPDRKKKILNRSEKGQEYPSRHSLVPTRNVLMIINHSIMEQTRNKPKKMDSLYKNGRLHVTA